VVVPFKQLKIFNLRIRVFYGKDPMLYTWHKDDKSRNVFFIPLGHWEFQVNNKLPEKISANGTYWIPAGLYHRLIRKSGYLISFIFE